MKVDFSQILKELDGSNIEETKRDENGKNVKTGELVTLSKIAVNALQNPDEKVTDGNEKMRRNKLSKRIYDAESLIDLKVEEVALIKELINKAYASPLVVGQTWEMLEGKEGE